jgi:thioredoxin 1
MASRLERGARVAWRGTGLRFARSSDADRAPCVVAPAAPDTAPDAARHHGRDSRGPRPDGHAARAFVSKFFGLFAFAVPAHAQTTPMSSELIKHVTDDSFETDVLKSDKPVLVDYWAEWCGPCKMIAPILDEAASQYGDRLQIAKMNVDENREIPGKFGIRGIPTLMLFKGGELAATKVGALSKAQLTAFLDGHL